MERELLELRARIQSLIDDARWRANDIPADGKLGSTHPIWRSAYNALACKLEKILERRKAPWADFAGVDIYEGDTILHPDGTRGVVVFVDGETERTDCKDYGWKVDYQDGSPFVFLGLQIGDKGQAVVVTD